MSVSGSVVRRDWTPLEKRYFEDVALQFLETHKGLPWGVAEIRFDEWLRLKDEVLYQYRTVIWSYVVTNWTD